ncbi:hypothetical protein [Fusobacterium varium]|uniref:Uncharacterized protein n=1 Tax=Fusobacterium varium ATCC 27725 TaxID=469618 RepID=A0ABN5JLP2_FUSVA|nr:hypothetical protein [Fusobacterium varium]AVQ31772.1 hypothetical protein C4N18_11310 [Fusobacterium varium ATCC 27725]EES63118.1 hypothetical protein FVAG_00807 [Fusobacterium varium ATCC 27725]VEH39397.1 Uncharacterised protein [Fusobacterium varium]
MKKYYHYAAKIYDSLKTGIDATPLYLSTKEGIIIDNMLCKPYMSTPSGAATSITPKNSQCSVSSITFKVTNINYEISKWLYRRLNSNFTMTYGEMVDVFALCENGRLKLVYRGLIRSISNDEFESEYEIEVADFQNRLKSSIFDREFSKYSTESILDINNYRLPYKMVNGRRIGFYIEERNEGETDENGNIILTRVIFFNGHVIDMVEMIFQIIFSTPVLEVRLPYLSNKWTDFVDIISLNSIRETLNRAVYNFYFEFREPIDDPYEFLIENIYKPCAIFPFVNTEGKLGLKLHKQPTIGTEEITLSEENIISVGGKTITDENIVNNMIVKYDYDFKEDKGKTKRYFSSSTSFNKFKMLIPDSPEEYEIKGINKLSLTDKATFSATLADSIFSRYGLPGIELEIVVPLEVAAEYKVGDYLFITHKTLIAWEGEKQGTPGIGKEYISDGDMYNGIAHFGVGHEWGGFIEDNTLGKAIDGTWVITTTEKQISHKIFNDTDNNFKSCLDNHNYIRQWLMKEGISV